MERTKINEYIGSLAYDREKVIAFNGNKVTNFEPKTQSHDENGTYYVVTRKKRSLENNFDVTVPSNNFSATYPGALIYANKNLVDGTPQTISAKRGKCRLTVNLNGMGDENSVELDEASYYNVGAAMDKILKKWYTTHGTSKTPALINYDGCAIHDEKSLQLKFGCDAQSKLGIDFSALKDQKKSLYIVRFTQVFYDASIDGIYEPADAFADSVTVDELKTKNVNAENPPAYVKSVSYGRQIYIKFESTSSAAELEGAIKGTVNVKGVNVSGDASVKYADVLKNTSCSFVVMGGSAENSGALSAVDNMNDINKVIFANVELSESNPAVPLTYKVCFLKDGMLAKFSGTTEFVEETVERFNAGEIVLEHTGGYVAKFEVCWDEIQGYDPSGNPKVVRKGWKENGESKTAGFETTIPLSGNCRNIEIKATHNTGLVWDPWRTTFHKKNLAMVPRRHVKIWGTTLNHKSSCTP